MKFSLPKRVPLWVGVVVAVVVLAFLFTSKGGMQMMAQCPGSQVHCPGVGCVSGPDKCFPGSAGGPSKVFSKETFVTKKACPGGTRTDGPCLME